MTYRSKTPERVIRELDVLSRACGVDRFGATDNILSLNHVDGVLAKLAGTKARPYRLF